MTDLVDVLARSLAESRKQAPPEIVRVTVISTSPLTIQTPYADEAIPAQYVDGLTLRAGPALAWHQGRADWIVTHLLRST